VAWVRKKETETSIYVDQFSSARTIMIVKQFIVEFCDYQASLVSIVEFSSGYDNSTLLAHY